MTINSETPAFKPVASFEEEGDYSANSLWRLTMRRLLRQQSALVGAIILGILVVAALFAPLITPYGPTDDLLRLGQDVERRGDPCIHLLGCPNDQPQHFMGVDANFRDQYSRIIYGARISLLVGFTTVVFASLVGTLLGGLAGYFGGWVDDIIMRLMDVLLAFPSLLLAIAIVAVLGSGIEKVLFAIAIVSIPSYARVVRANVLSIRELEYVEASRALGASHGRLLFQRILPNALTPLIVIATLGIGGAILDAAALSFLGFGAGPPTPEWGAMLGGERNQIFSAPHLVFFPGLAISITVLAFNLLGDGLRDALDPRLQR